MSLFPQIEKWADVTYDFGTKNPWFKNIVAEAWNDLPLESLNAHLRSLQVHE